MSARQDTDKVDGAGQVDTEVDLVKHDDATVEASVPTKAPVKAPAKRRTRTTRTRTTTASAPAKGTAESPAEKAPVKKAPARKVPAKAAPAKAGLAKAAVEPAEAETVEAELPTVADAADDKAADDAPAKARVRAKKSPRSVLGWLRRSWFAVVTALVLIAAVTLTCLIFFLQYQPDRQTDEAVSQVVLKAASDGAIAVLSYSPENLEGDLTTAKTHLTGDFLSYYSDFTQQVVAPAVKQKGVKTTASVVRSAVSELHPDRAVVLLFLNQTTVSTDRPDPAIAASSVVATLIKVDGNWLISKFEPV